MEEEKVRNKRIDSNQNEIVKGKLSLPKRKYRNVKTVVDGISFDSKKEAKRYGELKMMLKGGIIEELMLQVGFPITINGKVICRYVADFVYTEGAKVKVEDAKGFKTPVYNLKKKLMKAIHGIDIIEI